MSKMFLHKGGFLEWITPMLRNIENHAKKSFDTFNV